jgi:hypothetical protein
MQATAKATMTNTNKRTLDTIKGFVSDENGVAERLPIDKYLPHESMCTKVSMNDIKCLHT